MRTLPFACLLAASTLLLGGCDLDVSDWGDSQRFKEDFSSTHKLASGGRVMLEGFNGSVEIIGWERDSVELTGSKNAAREEVMKAIKIDVVDEPNSLRIRAIRPQEHNCNCGVRFALKVPKKVVLDLIQTSNGSIRTESLTGNVRLKTSNGSVNVWSVTGNLEAATSNASIEVGRFEGSADLKTSNGRIKADGIRGGLEARTSNASIDAQVVELDNGRPAVLSSSNGSVTLTLDNWKNNEIRATTSNSSINLRLPDKINADLRASTSNGHINCDFDVSGGSSSKTRLSGRINSGGPLIDATTSNGSIRVTKR